MLCWIFFGGIYLQIDKSCHDMAVIHVYAKETEVFVLFAYFIIIQIDNEYYICGLQIESGQGVGLGDIQKRKYWYRRRLTLHKL